MVSLVLITLKAYQLYVQSQNLARANSQLKCVLNSQPDVWVFWSGTEKKLICSKGCLEKLGLSKDIHLSPKHIRNIFNSFNYHEFFQTVHQSNVYQQECLTSEGALFDIYGSAQYIQNDWYYTLWLRDISYQTSKTDLYKSVIQEITHERDIIKDILDHVPWPIWYKNLQKKLVFCNKSYADTLDLSVDEIIDRQVLLTSPQTSCRTLQLTDLVIKTKQTQHQKAHIVIKNERNYVEFTEMYTDKGYVLGYLRRLNEQEKLENEISLLFKSNRKILEVVSLPVIIYNQNKQVEFFNNSFLKMFELEESWLETKPTYSEILEELRAKRKLHDTEDFQAYKNYRHSLFNNLLNPVEEILYYPNGRTVRMVTSPYHNGGLIITFNDITDWLTLERQYNTLLAVHRQVADNLFEGLVVFGTDNRVQLYNSAFCKMWNYTLNELIPELHLEDVLEKIKSQIDYLHYDPDWENFKRRIIGKIVDRGQIKEGRIKLHQDVVYDYLSVPLRDGSCLLTFLDVSDRYRIEKNLLERSEALEVAHEVKSDFITLIHRGIQYPLHRSLSTVYDVLKHHKPTLDELSKDHFKNISNDLDQVLRFVDDAYDLVSIEIGGNSLEKSTVDLIHLIEEIKFTLIDRAIEKDIKIYLSYDQKKNYTIHGDAKRLKQVLFNLLRNSILYGIPGEILEINLTDDAEKIEIHILNTQSIIPYEDSYGASKKLKRGQQIITGLGFSLIKKIIELHNGRTMVNHHKGTLVQCIFLKTSTMLIKN